MEYSRIAGIDKDLSRLVYGANGATCGEDAGAAAECFDKAYETGFRTFDTAHSYGNHEKNLGLWMEKRGIREELVILDKGCNPGARGSQDVFSAQTVRDQLEESLEKLRTDHVELYALHRDDPTKPVGEIAEALSALHEEGRIGRFGGSNWTLGRVREARTYALKHGLEPFSIASPAYCLAVYTHDPWGGSVSISGESGREYRKWLQDEEFVIFNYSALGRGYLSGKFVTTGSRPIEECLPQETILEYDCPENRARLHRAELLAKEKGTGTAQICLAWLLCQDLPVFPLVSAESGRHMEELAAALDIRLTGEEIQWLYQG